ncbi:hypothetical protein [Pedobacter glucosidilyticus]|nr:hypothetical protein [Pedobacter glucosidilyticus]
MITTIEQYKIWIENAPLEEVIKMGEELLDILNCEILGVKLLIDEK